MIQTMKSGFQLFVLLFIVLYLTFFAKSANAIHCKSLSQTEISSETRIETNTLFSKIQNLIQDRVLIDHTQAVSLVSMALTEESRKSWQKLVQKTTNGVWGVQLPSDIWRTQRFKDEEKLIMALGKLIRTHYLIHLGQTEIFQSFLVYVQKPDSNSSLQKSVSAYFQLIQESPWSVTSNEPYVQSSYWQSPSKFGKFLRISRRLVMGLLGNPTATAFQDYVRSQELALIHKNGDLKKLQMEIQRQNRMSQMAFWFSRHLFNLNIVFYLGLGSAVLLDENFVHQKLNQVESTEIQKIQKNQSELAKAIDSKAEINIEELKKTLDKAADDALRNPNLPKAERNFLSEMKNQIHKEPASENYGPYP